MIQPRFVSLAEDKPDVLGFVVVLWDETAEEERRSVQLACAKIPTVEKRRAVLSELNRKYPTGVGDPPDLVFFKAFNDRIIAYHQFKSVKQDRRSVPRSRDDAVALGKHFPRPIGECRFARFILYEYGDAEGWSEYWRITHSMRPLLAIPPRGITWPRREGNTYISDCTWPFTVFQWALDRMPGFAHQSPLMKTTPKGETVEWAHSTALNVPEASADGIAKLLTIEPVDGDVAPIRSRAAWVLLQHLCESPSPMRREDFCGKADPYDEKYILPEDLGTIGGYLNEVIEAGYACRPRGPRSGAVATDAGRRFVAEYRRTSSPRSR